MSEFNYGDRVRLSDQPDGGWGTVRDPRAIYNTPEWKDYAEDIIEHGWISVEWDDGGIGDGYEPYELVKIK